MPQDRRNEYDPFMEFLLLSSGFGDISTAAKETGYSRQTLYTYANRGVNDFYTMNELALRFGVGRRAVKQWMAQQIDKCFDEASLSESA